MSKLTYLEKVTKNICGSCKNPSDHDKFGTYKVAKELAKIVEEHTQGTLFTLIVIMSEK